MRKWVLNMADRALFDLDADGRWRLAYDALQWIVQRRKTLPCPSEVGSIAESRCALHTSNQPNLA